jgi:hypothetical protein
MIRGDIYSKAIKEVSEKRGTGKNISWHLKNGSDSYKRIFTEIAKMLQKTEGEILISKTSFLKKTGLPSSAAIYPLYKFESEEYLTIKANYIHVYMYQRENWEELCSTLHQ